MSFCSHSKKDWYRPYSTLFGLNTLFCLSYPNSIFVNTILIISSCRNVFILSNWDFLRLNLAITARKTCKKVIARVITLVDNLKHFFWLPYIINLALYFWSWLFLLIWYLKTHSYSNIWWIFTLMLINNFQHLNCYLYYCMWIFIFA